MATGYQMVLVLNNDTVWLGRNPYFLTSTVLSKVLFSFTCRQSSCSFVMASIYAPDCSLARLLYNGECSFDSNAHSQVVMSVGTFYPILPVEEKSVNDRENVNYKTIILKGDGFTYCLYAGEGI